MVLYLLILVTVILDLVTMKNSNNSKDKISYIISMSLVCLVGILYLRYGDEAQLIDRFFRLARLHGGV